MSKFYLQGCLQGVGCGACLMGPFVYLAKNMAKKILVNYSGIVMGFGGLGALFAFNPFYLITIYWLAKIVFFHFLFLIAIICFMLLLLLINLRKKKILHKKKDTFIRLFLFLLIKIF